MHRRLMTATRGRALTLAAVIAVFGASMVGAAAFVGAAVDRTPSSNPPSISVSFPTDGGSYNAATWGTGCRPGGICGSASDRNGVAGVTVAVRQNATGRYWNGSGFTSPTAVFATATGTSSWRYALQLPPEGAYLASVRATDSLGNTTPLAQPVKVPFTIDTTTPPAPSILQSPDPVTTARDAVFRLTSLDADARFRCQLDKQAAQSCGSTVSYAHLAIGDHCVRFFAFDAALNVSVAAQFCWTIGTRAFTISGDTPALSYPGVVQPVDLVFTNPYLFDLTVTSVSITIQDATTTPAGEVNPLCVGNDNFRVARALAGPVEIPARSSRSLSQLEVPVANWPQIEMLNLASNQDACKGMRFSLAYSGVGEKRL